MRPVASGCTCLAWPSTSRRALNRAAPTVTTTGHMRYQVGVWGRGRAQHRKLLCWVGCGAHQAPSLPIASASTLRSGGAPPFLAGSGGSVKGLGPRAGTEQRHVAVVSAPHLFCAQKSSTLRSTGTPWAPGRAKSPRGPGSTDAAAAPRTSALLPRKRLLPAGRNKLPEDSLQPTLCPAPCERGFAPCGRGLCHVGGVCIMAASLCPGAHWPQQPQRSGAAPAGAAHCHFLRPCLRPRSLVPPALAARPDS